MATLTDLFNPTFLIFLGILVLVVALLVVYFENKFREQNHKISSMLSLVSSLAEELNGTKMVIQHLSMIGGEHPQNYQNHQNHQPFLPNLEENNMQNTNKLIQVSDDDNSDTESESSDSDDSNGNDIDSDVGNDTIDGSDDDSNGNDDEDDNSSVEDLDNNVIEIGEHNDIKILKLNISNPKDDESIKSEDNNLDFEDLEDLENLSDSDTLSIQKEIEINDINDIDEDINHSDDIKSMDLKSIHINLEETKHESLDYKKMALPKLRSVVTEKGLTNDASKLKKNELLKLLGIE